MLVTLLIICLIVWIPIFFAQIIERGFYILLIWLLIAPFAMKAIQYPQRNPFYASGRMMNSEFASAELSGDSQRGRTGAYHEHAQSVTLKEVMNPTRVLFMLFFFMTILDRITRSRPILPLNRTEMAMGLFILCLIINVILFSSRLAFGLRTAIDSFLVPFLAYYAARRFITSEDRFSKFVLVLMSLAAVLVCVGLIERVVRPETLHRVRGPFPHRNYYYMVLMVPFFAIVADTASHWFTRFRSRLPTVLRYFVLCLAPVGIALTLTRGNMLGLACGIWLFVLMGQRLLHVRSRVLLTGLILTVIPLIFLTFQVMLSSVEGELDDRVGDNSTWYGRLATYSAVSQQVVKSPVIGIGFNNLRDVLIVRSVAVEGHYNYTTSHQSFLALLAETGMIGLSLYLMVAFCLGRLGVTLFKQRFDERARWRGVSILAVLAAYYVPAQLAHIVYMETFMHLYMYAYIGALAGLYDPAHDNPLALRVRWYRKASSPQAVANE